LNSNQIIIHGAEVTVEQAKSQQTFKATGIQFDVPQRRATISFRDALPVSDRAVITLRFQGTMNNDMAGFSRAKYKPNVTPAASVPMDGEHHLMFSTQFEACDARRAFPCFDEPNLKATFDFEVEIPSDLVALSNMPEKGIRKTKDGFHAVSFERTPVMSTYLLAWAVGDFEYIEDFTKRKYNGKALPVRVYTTRGMKDQAQYALSSALPVIDYFSEIFGIDYPLPKADLLAVHEFVSDVLLFHVLPSLFSPFHQVA
jgi:aminopeptidase N